MNPTLDKNGLVKTGQYTAVNPNFQAPMNPRVAAINAQIAGSPLGHLGISQAPSVNPTINATGLGSASPLTLGQPKPMVQADGLLGAMEATANSYSVNQQQQTEQSNKLAEVAAKKTETETSKKSLLERMGLTKGAEAQTDEAYSQTVDPIKVELDAINQQLLEEQNGLRKQIEAVGQNGIPLNKAQYAAQVEGLKRQSASKQADLSIIQMGVQGRYDSAKQIADRKVAVQLEKDKQDLEIARFNYEENKEEYTKAEQRQFEQEQSDRERALDAKEAKMKQFEDTRIALLKSANEQNAPAQVKLAIGNAKTTEEAIQAAGQYAGDTLEREIKQAQLANIKAETAKRTADALAAGGIEGPDGKVLLPRAEALKINKELTSNDAYKAVRKGQDSLQFLTSFETLFNDTGATSGVWSPLENAELKTKYNATILNLKEFFNLGVLNGPDEAILRGILPDPTNRSAFNPVANTSTKSGINNMKAQIESTLDDRFASLSAQYNAYSPDSVSSLGDLQRIYIQNKALVNPEVATLIQENPDLTADDIISIINTKL